MRTRNISLVKVTGNGVRSCSIKKESKERIQQKWTKENDEYAG
jgi:hypothetical protein